MSDIFKVIAIPKHRNLYFFLVFFLIEEMTNWGAYYLFDHFSPGFADIEEYHKQGLTFTFVLLVIVAPILETFFAQFFILEVLRKLKVSASISVVIAAIVFGLFHYYNIWYILATIISGFVFAYYYMALRPQGKWNKILLLIALHAMANIVAFFSTYA
ncbi:MULTISPECIES: CPBP family intramembrane glutamic endopeptidase [Sphingobacterium]|uniref:CAAX prenyl protease 2/Lysostaphin resistance protein A-like domain-containing protein n=1 Tax=Sphingobacterium athyrii TaxID=2152717 RepID=A0A363NN47_9SPHI|nr:MULTISPECIES: CPBP family intramembrane glutamic endopeptidase [Sphingobacterium]PUV22173.1 hypothetical protein DCO56_21625 [Sphingobacterium athyrii]QIH32283.1 CPBP family intramembrane metalloprotease [Sphingobacterium sp. DR205]